MYTIKKKIMNKSFKESLREGERREGKIWRNVTSDLLLLFCFFFFFSLNKLWIKLFTIDFAHIVKIGKKQKESRLNHVKDFSLV